MKIKYTREGRGLQRVEFILSRIINTSVSQFIIIITRDNTRFILRNKSASAAAWRALYAHGGLTGGNVGRPASSGVNTSLGEQEKQDCKVCIQRGARVRRGV